MEREMIFYKTMKMFFPNLFSTWEKCVSLNCGNFCRTTHLHSVRSSVYGIFDQLRLHICIMYKYSLPIPSSSSWIRSSSTDFSFDVYKMDSLSPPPPLPLCFYSVWCYIIFRHIYISESTKKKFEKWFS